MGCYAGTRWVFGDVFLEGFFDLRGRRDGDGERGSTEKGRREENNMQQS